MKKTVTLIALCLVAIAASLGLTASDPVTETYTIGKFSKIEVANGVRCEYQQSERVSCMAVGPREELDRISIKYRNGELWIGVKPDNGWFGKGRNVSHVTVRVTGPVPSKIEVGTSGKLTCSSLTSKGKLEIEAETSGSVMAPTVTCTEIDLEAETSGMINLKVVTTTDIDIETMTSGSVKIETLKATDVETEAETSGAISIDYLTATKIESTALTSGAIKLAGQVKTVVFNAETSGSINAGALKAANGVVSASTNSSVNCDIQSVTKSSTSTSGRIKNGAR